jgi:pimeloyl-ACP methyl ester carboxylesterase
VLLVHGIPTSAYLWRHVLRMLQNDLHCYAPDLMGLGDTEVDPDRGRFDMEAQSEMLLEFMQAVGHERFAAVCHDQGGAAVQLLAARCPQRLTALVCTDCVCYDNWPVPVIARLQAFTHLVPFYEQLAGTGIFRIKETLTPFSAFRGGVYDPAKMSDRAIEEYLRPLHAGPRQRRRFLRFLRAGSARHTLTAVEGLRRFTRPTLVVWAADDRYISPSWGRRLYEDIPGAERFELVPFCGHFWQEERPAEFATIIGRFLAQRAAPVADPAGDCGPPGPGGDAGYGE